MTFDRLGSLDALKFVLISTTNRADLDPYLDEFIQEAEARIAGDQRVREMTNRATLIVPAATPGADNGYAAPGDFLRIVSLSHTDDSFTPIRTTSPAGLVNAQRRYGATGKPRYVSVVGDRLYFGPEPNDTYILRLVYERALVPLTDESPTNWVLEQHPLLYKFGALAAAHRFLKYDERADYFDGLFEQQLEKIHLDNWNTEFGGTLERQFDPIG